MASWILESLHFLALGIGLWAVWMRGQMLLKPLDPGNLKRIFDADMHWGFAAGLWIVTGLIRAFTGLEQGSGFYLQNTAFLIKMGLLLVVIALEIAPMTALIRWRIGLKKGEAIDTSRAGLFARISYVQAILIVAMIFAASAITRF